MLSEFLLVCETCLCCECVCVLWRRIASATWSSTTLMDVAIASFALQVLMQDVDLVTDFLVQFFYYLLLLYGFVPISLYVSQNFIRYFQASVCSDC